MDRDADRHRLLTRRALTLGGLQLGLLGTLVGRLYYLQIVQSSRYAMLADENRISLQLLAPPRGEIMDRYGVPLAINQQNFRLQANTEQIRDLNETLAQLARIVPVSETDLKRIEREHRHQHRFVPLTIRENLSWDQVSAIELNAPDLPGVSIDVGQTRHYPYGEATAHVLGYVGLVAETELTGEPLLALPGFRIGKSGVEKTHDVDLRGTAGTSQMEVNNVGRIIRELSRQEGTPGSDVTLTLDIGLQTFAQDRLKDEQSAAAVVIDVHTGGIYALASYPSYDVNQFTLGINNELWHSLITNPTAPLTDKVVAGQYAPGSTFKTMVAMAALETGTIGPDHTVFCPGSMQLGDHTFHCWKHGGHGTVDMIEAVAQSCDVYFYDLAKRIGIDKIAETAREFGLGSKLDIDLQGERPGNIPDQAWKKRVLNASWQQGETLVNAIGQGYVLATPLQLAVMCARLANGGFAVKPHLTKQVGAEVTEASTWPQISVSQTNLATVLAAMNAVTNGEHGTARESRIKEAGFEMGGKTGTSQVRRISLAERATGVLKNENLPWNQRDHALFVGFAPVNNPRYAICVVVEHGGGGSHVAAPIARDILLECQKRDPAHSV